MLALVGVAMVRRPHNRLWVLSAALVVLGYLIAGLGFFVEGAAALGVLYLGALVVLIGLVGVVVFGVAGFRARRESQSSDVLPRI